MRQEAGRCPGITLLWVTRCLQLQNDSRNEDGRRDCPIFQVGSSTGRGTVAIQAIEKVDEGQDEKLGSGEMENSMGTIGT